MGSVRDGSTPGASLDENADAMRAGPTFLSNHAGGILGGISTGQPVVVRVAFKPLSTLMRPLRSADIRTKTESVGNTERSDVCAIPAAAVIAEAVVAFELANAFVEKFGGDSRSEIARNYEGYLEQVRNF